MIFDKPSIKPSGDRAIRVTFGDERSLRVHKLVRGMYEFLRESCMQGVVELVPTYASLTLMYDPEQVDYTDLVPRLDDLARRTTNQRKSPAVGRLLSIPVCYESDYAPDMDYICQYTGLEPDNVISIHTDQSYYVFQLGFTPGCPFIGPLQEVLHVPLMQSPRTYTPQGAVAISVGQTVIYPRSTPGGMRIIGRTPVQLFQLEHPDLTLFKPGDQVRFRAVSKENFQALEAETIHLYQGVEIKSVT